MRLALPLALFIIATASGAQAQSNPYAQNPSQAFGAMKPQDAAKLNAAAASDPQARQALDKVEKELSAAGHPAGVLLQKTR